MKKSWKVMGVKWEVIGGQRKVSGPKLKKSEAMSISRSEILRKKEEEQGPNLKKKKSEENGIMRGQ